jgi:hypothetical protein
LERTVKRLHSSEANLQTEVERLKHDLAAIQQQLLHKEAELFKLQQSPNDGALQPRTGWNGSDFTTFANLDLSPSGQSEGESFTSSSATLVWVETRDDQPFQMHVQRKDDVQVVSEGQSRAAGRDIWAVSPILKKNITAYVSQLDVVVVGMEFVLK